ncbi:MULTISPECIES: transposase [unclassified Streptomyces]|uniref:transposase n=1 Tax=Streptomyces sp. NBC_01794 TaxID=2975942 RepID=UPI002DD839F7|nr:transposase [Streptomyces sp. NBC_01750]WSB03744.1 transposase [Streptomyces sp. NBC_01794]WSD31968.1 transposase [Streptomyces sp. NBC_01750]
MLVWDNVRLHLARPLREFIAANADWLTIFQLPTCAPDLNPAEASGPWSSATSATSPPPTSPRSPARSSAGSRSSSSSTGRA